MNGRDAFVANFRELHPKFSRMHAQMLGGRKIVLWQEKRLGVLDFEKPEGKKEFFERGPEIEWATENAGDVRQAYFAYESSHVLYLDGDETYLSRIEDRGTAPEKLVRVRKGSDIFYAEKAGKLYYLEPSKGFLASVDILPESITFSGVISEIEKETQGGLK